MKVHIAIKILQPLLKNSVDPDQLATLFKFLSTLYIIM